MQVTFTEFRRKMNDQSVSQSASKISCPTQNDPVKTTMFITIHVKCTNSMGRQNHEN